MIELVHRVGQSVLATPADPEHRLFGGYLVSALVIATALGALRGARGPLALLAWVFPWDVWSHPSVRADLAFTVLQSARSPLWAGVRVAWTTFVAVAVARRLDDALGSPGWLVWSEVTAATLTVSLLAVTDFTHWLTHWLHHRVPFLWPLHAVHHSAPVLTPLTVYRRHPLYDALKFAVEGVGVGAFQGVMVYLFAAPLQVWTLGGVNAVYALFLLAGANLRHSHVWWSWGPLDLLFISPAQHQLHHSDDPKHEGNYGSILAVWDWLAGTRVEARTRPEGLRFGAFGGEVHSGPWGLLGRPVIEALRAGVGRRGQKGRVSLSRSRRA